MAKITKKNIFFNDNPLASRWGKDYGDVRNIFKLVKKNGDYAVRIADATIEHEESLFTKYPNKFRHHLVLDKGACHYSGVFKKDNNTHLDFYRFDGNYEISCRCERPGKKQRVINVVCDPNIEVHVKEQSKNTSFSYTINATEKWQVDFLYFDFDDSELSVHCLMDSSSLKLKPYSSLLIESSQLNKNIEMSFLLDSIKNNASTFTIYHFKLVSEKGEYYDTQAS